MLPDMPSFAVRSFRPAAIALSVLASACGSSGASSGSNADASGGSNADSGANGAGGNGGTSTGGGAASGGTPTGTGGVSQTSGGSAGTDSSTPPLTCSAESIRTGEATYYTFADGTGNCGFDASPNDLMIGAMNATDYAGSAACGGCAHLDGPSGSVTIRIVDQCPECPQGNIDLSPDAFDRIAARALGRVPISWQYVPCPVTGPVVYRFKEGSNQWWTAIQVRNHRYRIAKFEYEKDGAFVAVNRETYNYFVEPSGMGPGPYTFRITDINGDSLVDTGIVPQEATEVPGEKQFPECP